MQFPKMIGTTGSTFTVVGVFAAGHIGFRSIENEVSGGFRVRIAEYQTKEVLASLLPSWKQPNEYNVRTRRFSTVVVGQEALLEAIAAGSAALTAVSNGTAFSSPVTTAPAPVVTALTAKIAAAQAKFDAAQAAYDAANDAVEAAESDLTTLQELDEQLQEALAA